MKRDELLEAAAYDACKMILYLPTDGTRIDFSEGVRAFSAGANWERERAKPLVEALKSIGHGDGLTQGLYACRERARAALEQYEEEE